jgi:hypothetical protein
MGSWRPMTVILMSRSEIEDMSRSAKAPRRRGQRNHMFKVG